MIEFRSPFFRNWPQCIGVGEDSHISKISFCFMNEIEIMHIFMGKVVIIVSQTEIPRERFETSSRLNNLRIVMKQVTHYSCIT